MRRLAKVLGIVLVIAVIVFLDMLFGPIVDASYPVRVTGKVVDQETGQPIADAWVMTLPRLELARDEAHVAKWASRLQHDEGPMLMYGGTRTGDDGSFSFLVEVGWGWKQGVSSIAYGGTTPPPFYSLGCVVVFAEGFQRTTADVRAGEWEETPQDAKLFARLRVGAVHMRRRE